MVRRVLGGTERQRAQAFLGSRRGPDVSLGELKQERFMVGNLISDDSDLMLVGN